MVFVGLQIRQSNIQARAAAFQEIGIATAEAHRDFQGRRLDLFLDAAWTPERMTAWTRSDWELHSRMWIDIMRMYETLQLQVEQRLLPEGALDRLGYGGTPEMLWTQAGFVCLWPFNLRAWVGEATRDVIEAAEPREHFDCGHIDLEGIYRLQVDPQPLP
jgi:hypothetical protein